MVVDQRTLRANMLRNNIGANVFNKLTGQQAQTPAQQPVQQTQTTPTIQPTQNNDTITVKTTKFPTYDIKDLMGAGGFKNQISLMQNVAQYNKLQQQAQANTNPNIRYDFNKPQITNKPTLELNQGLQPEVNDQGLKINKTASFSDLIADLSNVASQGRNLEFAKFRDLYPEYVQNRSTVVDIFNDIKNGNTQDLENKYQKSNPEMFGVGDNFSNSDRTQALQRLYTDILNNKESGTKIDTETLTSKYPEFANTQDVNTIKEMENLLFNSENTPTINDIATIYPDLLKGEVEIGNAEKKTMKDDISKIENMSQSTYNHLSDEGKKYVEYLSTAEAVKQALGDQYYVGDKSGVEIAESLKNSDPELYKQIFGDVNISNLSEEDRKLLDEGYTIGAINSMRQQIKHSATEGLAGLGRKLQERAGTERKGERNPQPVRGQREDGTYEFNPLLKEDGTYETNPIKIREIKMAGNNYQQRVRTQEYRGKNPGMDKLDFKLGELLFGLGEEMQRAGEKGMEKIESSQSWKDVAELNKTSFWDALKKGDVKTMLSKSTAAIGQSAIPLVVGYATGNPVATFGAMYPGSYERAMQDIEADENLKDMTQEEKERAARLMATTESAIEEISLSMVAPKMFGDKSILDMIGGESFKKLMNNAIIKGITQTELGAASEGGEEVLQELFNNLITQSYGSDRELGDLQDYRNIFSETFLSSQLLSAMGGTMEGVDQARQNQIENQIKEQGELRNTVLEGQAIMADNFNDFASAVEQVPGTTTEELQQVWNNAQQKKQDLENKANGITSNSYNNVNVPTYERTTVKENEQPKLSAKDSQEYTDLLDEMEKNGEITEEDRKKVEEKLGIFTRNVEQPKAEGLANIQKTNETKSETSTEEKRNIIDRIVDKGASIVTKTVSAQDKLYKAQEPRMNVLSNKKNLEKRRANSDRANELIVENGYKPTNTEERLNAHQATLNKLWDQVKEQVKQGEGITVDQTPIINALSEYIAEKKKLGIAGIESEIKALERELNAMKKSQEQGKTDLPVLEQKKQVFNDMIDWKEQEASEVYKGGLRLLTHEIGKVEDDLISKIPGEFTKLKQDVGALLDTYEDVFKAHMKNQRSKGIGLTETYSRIEGIGDMLQGIIGVFKGEGGKVISGAGKVLLGKSLARAKDVDFLIKKGFEELSNEMGSNNKNDNDTTTDKNDTPPTKPNKPKNNGPKPQTQPETEKKSEKKTNKAEQVQAKKKNNQNTKPKTKGLAKINETKEETKTEGLATVTKEEKRLGNESDYTKDEVFYDQDGDVDGKISKGDKSITYNVDGNTNNTYIDGRSISNFIGKEEGLLGLVAKLEESMKERGLNNLYVEIDMSDYYPDGNVLSEYDEDGVKLEKDKEPEDRAIIENDPRWKSFVNEMEELGFELQDDNIGYKKFYKDTEGSFLVLDEHAGEQPLFNMEKYQEEWAKDSYYRGQANKLDQKQMDRDTIATMENEDMETDFRETAKNQVEAEKQGLAEISVKVENGKVVKESENQTEGMANMAKEIKVENGKIETVKSDSDLINEIKDDVITNMKKPRQRSILGKPLYYQYLQRNGEIEINKTQGSQFGNYYNIILKDPSGLKASYILAENDGNWTIRKIGKQDLAGEDLKQFYDTYFGKATNKEVESQKVEVAGNINDPIREFKRNNQDNEQVDEILNKETTWTDYDTGIKYKGTKAQEIQQKVDKLMESGKVTFRNDSYGKTMSSFGTTRFLSNDTELNYAKFLYDNPQIRQEGPKAKGLKEAIEEKKNSIVEEQKKVATEGTKDINPDKVLWQQNTYKEGVDKVYGVLKQTFDDFLQVAFYSDFLKNNPTTQEMVDYRTANGERIGVVKARIADVMYNKLGFKSNKSKEFVDLNTNIAETKGNEAKLRAIANTLYIDRVRKDIKEGYNYPQEVINAVPGLRTAQDNYERYLKGRDTSFSSKDARIDYSEQDILGAGTKRQDGKQITEAQRKEIVDGVTEYQEVMGIDMKKMAEDIGLVYVHLNGKHPFLTARAVGVFHPGYNSISVGAGRENYREKDGKNMTTHTADIVMAHEITHAIDSIFDWNLFSEELIDSIRHKMTNYKHAGAYWKSKEEVTARMVEEYVSVMKGSEGYFDMNYYWNKEDFENYVKPAVEKIFNEKFADYKIDKTKAPTKVGGKDIAEIKADAITRGLAEISNF